MIFPVSHSKFLFMAPQNGVFDWKSDFRWLLFKVWTIINFNQTMSIENRTICEHSGGTL